MTDTWFAGRGEVVGEVAVIDVTKRRGRCVLWVLRRLGVLR